MTPITVIINKSEKTDQAIVSLSNLQPEILIKHKQSFDQLVQSAKNDWILYLKEKETVVQIKDSLTLDESEVYGVLILQEDIIVKEARLWNRKLNLRLKNPVFEKLSADATKVLDILINQEKDTTDVAYRVDAWKQANPLAIEPYYYKAFIALSEKRFIEFKSLISYYLFHSQKADVPYIMARYYLALVNIMEANTEDAIKNLIICLSENPLMAEFWCLLGDIFVLSEKFVKAVTFYENAMILGSKRLKLDLWPIHIAKYEAYPREMIDKCKNLLTHSTGYLAH